jgi:predicted acylesterase/phospholipase RssA
VSGPQYFTGDYLRHESERTGSVTALRRETQLEFAHNYQISVKFEGLGKPYTCVATD